MGINVERISRDEYLKFSYVSLRTILSEIFARDEKFIPNFMMNDQNKFACKFDPPSKNKNIPFGLEELIRYAIESSFKTRVTQRVIKKDPLEFSLHVDFLYTQFDEKLRKERME